MDFSREGRQLTFELIQLCLRYLIGLALTCDRHKARLMWHQVPRLIIRIKVKVGKFCEVINQLYCVLLDVFH